MRAPRNQRGITLVLIAIAMLALVAMAGLALDVSRLVENQARLQATVDATAMSAAKALDDTTSTDLAFRAAFHTFFSNARQDPDLFDSHAFPTVQFSSGIPFITGTTPAQYVQVNVPFVRIPLTLAVLGLHSREFFLNASAVAGPSPTLNNASNLTPLMMCGTAQAPGSPTPVFGYYVGQIIALQLSSGTPQAAFPNDGSAATYLTLSSGVYSEDQDFAGAYSTSSTVGNTDLTATGTATPSGVLAADGLDTRLNEYLVGDVNPASYPPDVITTQPPIGDPNRLQCTDATCVTIVNGAGITITNSSQDPNYSYEGMYLPSVLAGAYNNPPAPAGNGVFNRRVLAVPVGDCTASTPAGGPVPVLGFACVFTLQDVDATGDANTGQVFGEVLNSCQVNGTPGPFPNNAPGVYSIQLYHVLGSPQS
jgi:Putative Flp pilus-assembly TadE/G-like